MSASSRFDLLPDRRARFASVLDLLAEKLTVDEPRIGVEFPHVTEPDGRWRTHPASWSAGYTERGWSHGHWTCGFWVGLLVAAYLHTGERRFLTWASERMRLVEQRASDSNTHDIGFIFDGSAVVAHHVTREPRYAEIALRAASRLRSRIVPTASGAYLSSWGPLDDPRARRSSAIDTMANLPLLLWAAGESGDASFLLAACAHADKTVLGFIRDDGSTYHAVEYDTISGARVRGYTFQGFADESTWSRGQAWAAYGYSAMAGVLPAQQYRQVAHRVLEVFLHRLGGSRVPPWDFDDPRGDRAQRDSAAGAVLASAMLDLAVIEPDDRRAHECHARAITMLDDLIEGCLAQDPGHRGLLRHGCYSMPHDDGTDAATMFGDFFFVEALCKVLMPGRFRPHPRDR